MNEQPEPQWPANILPALKRRADASEPDALLALHPRIVVGLRELAQDGDDQARQLVTLIEQWSGDNADGTAPVHEVRTILAAQPS